MGWKGWAEVKATVHCKCRARYFFVFYFAYYDKITEKSIFKKSLFWLSLRSVTVQITWAGGYTNRSLRQLVTAFSVRKQGVMTAGAQLVSHFIH